jgi:hypothetical protein
MTHEAKIQLRLPTDVHQWIVEHAKQNDRSMNGQMIAILREEMKKHSTPETKPVAKMLGG